MGRAFDTQGGKRNLYKILMEKHEGRTLNGNGFGCNIEKSGFDEMSEMS